MSNVKPIRYVRSGSDTVGLSEIQTGETIAFADIEAHDHDGVYQPADADIPTVSASQAEMEAGTETALRSMSPLRVAQAIDYIAFEPIVMVMGLFSLRHERDFNSNYIPLHV